MFKRRGTKLVIHVHSDFTSGQKESFKNRLLEKIGISLLSKIDRVIYVSESMYNHSKVKNKVYIPNAIVGSRLPNDLTRHTDMPTFLMFGWSPKVKGVDIAVKAINYLNDELHTKAKLLLVHSKKGTDELFGFLQSKGIDTNNDLKYVELLTPTENVFDYYLRSNVFISSSRSEGFSYSILEALSIGMPVIMSDIEGTKWASKYGSVFSYKAESYYELALKMKELIDSCETSNVNNTNIKIMKEDYSLNNWIISIQKEID